MKIWKVSKIRKNQESNIVIKEVIKEVPVDRVVFRDVPVEIVKKEIVHVPLWTADKSKINLAEDVSDSSNDSVESWENMNPIIIRFSMHLLMKKL